MSDYDYLLSIGFEKIAVKANLNSPFSVNSHSVSLFSFQTPAETYENSKIKITNTGYGNWTIAVGGKFAFYVPLGQLEEQLENSLRKSILEYYEIICGLNDWREELKNV
jgi:hypothetical protein